MITNVNSGSVVLRGKRHNNVYKVCVLSLPQNHLTCLSALDNDVMLWHKRLGHASLSLLNRLFSNDLVVGLPFIKYMMTRCATLVLEESKLELLSSQRTVLVLPDLLNYYMLICVVL